MTTYQWRTREILAAPNPDKTIRISHAVNYPHRVWFCLAGVIAFLSLCNFTATVHQALTRGKPSCSPRKRGSIQYRRLPAAIANTFRAVAFRWTIPIGASYTLNLTEVFFTAAYIVLLFAWTLVNSTNLSGEKFDPRYWANVAGATAASQLPFIAALGTKNNVIGWLTGISFEKLNYLHRMSARVLVIVIWAHAGGRSELGFIEDATLDHAYIRCGILAGTSLTLLTILSMRPLRKRNYEVFLFTHLALALIVVIGATVHTQHYDKPFQNYAWTTFVIWGTDRIVRLIRIILFNTSSKNRPRTVLDGHVESLSPHLLRITLPRPARWYIRWRPGQSASLSLVPSIAAWKQLGSVGLEAHPFTIASVDYRHNKTPEEQKVMFLLRVRNGFTKGLMNAVQHGNTDMKFLVDGPYGSPPIVRGYETVVLIAGGSGISFTLPLLIDLISRSKRSKSDCTRVVFVWVVRGIKSISWIAEEIGPALRDIPSTCTFDIRVHVTTLQDEGSPKTLSGVSPSGSEPTSPDIEKSAEGETTRSGSLENQIGLVSEMFGVDVKFGRPDVKEILKEEIKSAIGDVSVNVCGNFGINNAVREALSPVPFWDVLRGGPSVSLHVEAFGDS